MADAARMVRQEVVRLWLDKKVRNKRGPSDSVPPSTVPTQLVPVRGLQEPVVSSDSGGSEQHDNPDLQCLLAKMRVAFADLHESWLAKDLESILKSRLDTCRRRDGTGKSQAAVTRMMALIERVAADQRALVEWTPGPQVAGDDCVGTRPLKGFGPGDESAAFAAWIAEGNLQRYESNFGAMLPDYLVRLEADLLKGQAEAPSLQEVLETTVARLAWQAVEEFKLRRRRQGDLANGRLARAVSDAQERALIRPAGCGHTRYSMLFVPPEEFTALNDTLKCHPVSSKVFPTNATASFVLCEAERLSLAQIAHTLVESRPDLVDTARRYHVRNDIDWQILPCIMSNADKLDTQVR